MEYTAPEKAFQNYFKKERESIQIENQLKGESLKPVLIFPEKIDEYSSRPYEDPSPIGNN